MIAYEFADEVGLRLLGAYPVRRDGQKVYVKTSELSSEELDNIYGAIQKLGMLVLDRLILLLLRGQGSSDSKKSGLTIVKK